jgi:hypothetical protein
LHTPLLAARHRSLDPSSLLFHHHATGEDTYHSTATSVLSIVTGHSL